ncbi:type I polyketide synthase [Streptomyces sp. AN091965]|uniref:type I polyketide synthase n=1 Tax=Streptomyces sp. AN091965 TaxID=2927803 RepID=UPI001F613761|nr:SDR family NAD(P)-dependent oxidoreductase [Streptomyces sp. AN091965]MCI3928605.1 SDR family NAD(P)-dependent oxidoreductase [Streptomyces sp. AN091965]
MNVPESPAGTSLLWALSAARRGALTAQARRLRDHLRALPEWSPADVGLTLARAATATGRRAALVAGDRDAFLERLDALADGRGAPGLTEGPAGPGGGIAFVFPGQGSQWPAMAARLLDSAPRFGARVDACAQALEPFVDWPLMDVLRAADGAPPLERPDVVQPALFAVGVGLAGLWRDHGVEPTAVLGHSCGEISAAAVSGALSLDDGARVVALWSQAQATLSGRGEMVSVMASLADVEAQLADYEGQVGVAAVNGPRSVIVSGDTEAATELTARLTAAGLHARRIAVGLAAHSPHIDAIVPRLHADLAPVRPLPAQLPYYSGLTGDLLPEPALDAAYWARNLRRTVRFDRAAAALLRDGHHTLLEISPHPVLTTALQAIAAEHGVTAHVGATLRRGHGDRTQFLTALGEMYVHGGAAPDPEALCEGLDARPADLPAELLDAADDTGTEDPRTALRDELAPLTATGQRERLLRLVGHEVAAVLGEPGPVDPDATFTGLGLDSVTAVEIRNRVTAATGAASLPVTAVFDHPTPRALAEALRDELLGGARQEAPAEEPATVTDEDPVAIVAMGCRFPGGADTPERLWRLLADGTDAVTEFPGDRGWNTAGACAPEDTGPGRHYQREAGFLHEADRFDAEFFGISPREALVMDPQQRLLLETSWEALERAGFDPHTLRGSRTGVYIGAMTMDYAPRLHEATDGNGHLLTGNTGSVASGRIAYALGLEGAAVTVDTACSSSLVALHLAVQSLRRGECALALAGGATVMPTPGMFVEFSSQGGLAPDGRCKAFSAQADGFGLAEGVGVLLLERLSDARRHGHPVLAVVRGSAVNQDGASNGLTAPNGPSQQRVIRAALADAGLSAKDVDAVEAHGTGTRLGDPIEAQALLATYGQERLEERPLWLGSLKSNIGHTQAAAGVGGVMKMVLAMRHGLLPRTLHLTEPTPYVDWSAGDIRLLTEPTPWPESDRPRRAGVSGFGISGTNAHVIVEEVPQESEAAGLSEVGGPVPWVVSARSPQALRAQAERLLELCGADDVRLGDVALSLATTRSRFESRAVVVAEGREQLMDGVRALVVGEPSSCVVSGGVSVSGGTVFVFPGQGAQWVGMARELLDESSVFAGLMGECEAALGPYVEWSLVEVVRSGVGFERVDVVQPVLFAVMVSLARWWRVFGVVADAVVGHSQGEIAAAVVAGGLSLEDGARVVALRSRAIVRLAGSGGMVSLALSSAEVEERLAAWGGRLSVAAVNGPSAVVVSGDTDALDELLEGCEAEGVRARRIDVDYASHSAHVERIEAELLEALEGISPVAGDIPLYSTVTGEWLDTSVMDAGYWYTNLRRTVAFEPAIRSLAEQGFGAYVEVSPHPVLTMAVEATLESAESTAVVLGTLRRDQGGLERMLLALGQAHVHGLSVDWAPLFEGTGATRVELPTYPFQRERFWLGPQESAAPAPDADGLWESLVREEPARLAETLKVTPQALDEVLPALSAWRAERTRERSVDAWRHRVAWEPLELPPAAVPEGRWLVVCPEVACSEEAAYAEGAEGAEGAAGPGAGAADDILRGLRALGLDLAVVTAEGPGQGRAGLASALADAVAERPVAGVLSLLADERRPHPDHADLPGGLALTLALVQALGDAGIDAPLWCVTRGTAVVGTGERPGPSAYAAVAGLGRCVALEHPDRWGGLADLPVDPDERALRRLCAVLAAVTDEDQVAVRSTGVHGRRLRPAPVTRGGALAVEEGFGSGTVLITGGTGGVGAHVARWLAAQGAGQLLLVSRRGPQAPGAAALRAELADAGAAVTVAACDVADPGQVAALLGALPKDRPLTAVVHAAGVLDDGMLDALTPARLAVSLRAKTTAARVLHEATAGLDLSAFVVFTSVMGVVGNAGQGNYAAANAALESLVAARRAAGLPGTALAWGAWAAGEGMLDDGVAGRLRDRGLPSMDPAAAVTAIGRALAEDDGHVVVADADWRRFAAATGLRATALLGAYTGRDGDDGERAPGAADGTLRDRLAAVPAAERDRFVTDLVRTHAAAVLRHPTPDAVRPERAFNDMGFDSLTAVELRNRLAAATGVRLPATVLFDRPTPAVLAAHLLGELGGAGAESGTDDARDPGGAPPAYDAEPIAIVGMGCRFPGGVERPADLWRLLAEGRDAVTDWPADRGWDAAGLYDPDPDRAGTTYCTQGAFVTDAAGFDAEFFGISPREALAMDPQQRLLLETSWEALERAGQDPEALRGRRVGVFVGTNGQDYMGLAGADPEVSEGHLLTGNTASVLSGRVAYVLGLEGPALTVDTACSSSLVAVHLAAQALRRGDCEQAFAGGVTVMSTPRLFVEFSRQRGLARDGRCKAFGAGADGTSWGEGAGVLLLERLSDARRNGHPVLAVLRGSAVNQDGASNGLTAPNGPAQQDVIRAALADAGLRADQVDAVEAHGTGTVLGDPIEAQALQAVHAGRPAGRPLWLGSVKSNIGHTQAAAGVAGLMKMVLALDAGELPGTLHAEEPNPHVDWSTGSVRLLTGRTPWPETGEPRRAGVSSFGISGTNAHVIVEQAPPADAPGAVGTPDALDAEATRADASGPDSTRPDPTRPDAPRTGVAVPLLLSARTPDALRAQAARLRTYLSGHRPGHRPPDEGPGPGTLAGTAHALATRRAALDHRAAVLGRDPDAVLAALAALAEGNSSGRLVTGHTDGAGRTAFLFPGQGSQRAGAGAELYRREPVFADALDAVLTHLAPHLSPELELPLRDVMFAAPGTDAAALIDRTGCTQPALFALQVALFRLTEHWGVRPDLLLGHSVGELAAAHVAGVLDLPDACALVAARGRLMDALPGGGAMAAVEADEDEVRALLAEAGEPGVCVAAVNGPRATVLSGDRAPVLRLAESFRARGRRTKELAVSHAFHSARVDGMLDAFRAVARQMTYAPPRVPVISNLTGARATADDLCDPEYWVRHVRGTVRFLDGARTLLAESATSCLELGTGGVLSGLVEACRTDGDDCRAVPLLRDGRDEAASVTGALAALHVRGAAVDWSAGCPDRLPRLDDLPTYPFRHRRYWPAPRPAQAVDAADTWTYRVAWRALPEPAATPALTGTWLLVVPEAAASLPLTDACRGTLAEHGAAVSVLTVPHGTDRAGLAALVPAGANGVLSLLATAPAGGTEATLLLVQALGDAGADAPLWCVTTGAVAVDGRGPDRPEQAQVWGLGRVAALEHPGRWGGLADLAERPDAASLRRLCALLSGSVRTDGGCAEDQVALRADGLHGRRLLRAARAPAHDSRTAAHDARTADGGEPVWSARGTVLVTGGTGGLGAHVARRLARDGAEHLVLTSRRGPQAPGAAELAADIEALGARVTVAACDVADRDALAELLDRLAADGDAVRAVFHAAGVTSDTRVADCTPALLAEETAAKVRGAVHLDDLLGGALDAFVLFSSVSATWGSAGQATYAAANAHLDALAERRRADGRAAVGVAWGPWAGAGMAHGATGAGLRRLGLVPMAPEAALDALWRALERDDSGTVVADMDWPRFAPAFRSSRDSALLAELPDAATEPGPAADDTVTDTAARWRDRLAALPHAERPRALTDLVRAEAAAVLGHDSAVAVAAARPFHDIGFDSLTAVELRNRLAAATGLTLPASTVFDHPTATALGGHLHAELTGAAPAPQGEPARPAATDEPLAVIGMACRFPGGVRGPEDLWDLVTGERDAVGPLPADRGWPLDDLYDPDPEREGTFYTTGGGFLDGAGDFDAGFFGISPREALAMDPQQRLLLETAWEALERAGIDPGSVRGSQGGVYLGVAAQGYGTGPQDPAAAVEGHLLSGTVTSVASGRIAYTLGTEGPAVTVETACSSSLVALHLAGQALRAGECSFALVGGAAVMASPDVFVEFSRQRGLAPDGRCKSFAAAADGTGWGEGVGMLVVERLSEARRRGHPVLAVVRGSAVNQDGASNGLTAPSGPAQERVLRRALAAAGLTGADVDLVEAHGTGTVLGDPIEAQSLLAVYGRDRPAERPLWLGSLKSNIGHTQAAAGVAGVIKTVMALRHGLLPRTLHVDTPTAEADWSRGAVRLLTEARPWDDTGRPRRAGVSSFGMSGTNAHAVLEQAPDEPPLPEPAATAPAVAPIATDTVALPLSAASAPALRAQARRLREHAEAAPALPLADLAHALATTRTAFPHRAAVTGRTRDELLAALAALADGAPAPGVATGRAGEARTVFVFPGQGSQWPGMARELLDTSPEFAARITACAQALAPHTDWSLLDVLKEAPEAPPLERVDVVQPVLFAVMVSLAEVWRSYGVEPAAVVGHSQGEIAAACVAGALTLEDAALVVALRSRELRRLAGRGGMVSLAAPEAHVRELLLPYDGRIGVAAVNGPGAVVVAGAPDALTGLQADCEQAGVRARRLPVDYAAHSAQVADVGDALRTALAGVRPRPSHIPLYSTVTGDVVDGTALDADYWYRNLREPVEFARTTETLLAAGHDLFVEASPHPVLTAALTGTAERAERPVAAVGTLRRDDGGTDRLLTALAEAWTHGAPLDWAAALPRPAHAHVPLPTYAFQHERYWLATPGRTAAVAATAPAQAPAPVPNGDPAAELAVRLAPLDGADRRRAVLDLVTAHAAAVLGHSGRAAVEARRPFTAVGFDSMLAVTFRNRLGEATGLRISPTAVFDHPTPAALADHLHQRLCAASAPDRPDRPVHEHLDGLAAALAAAGPDTPGADAIGTRLRDLLRAWNDRLPQDGGGADGGPAVDTATADELFELLDNNYGA